MSEDIWRHRAMSGEVVTTGERREHEMTGIERLRELAEGAGADVTVWMCADDEYNGRHGLSHADEGGPVGGLLSDIADQMEREQACDGDTTENIRLVVGGVIDDMERHVLGHEGMDDSPVARWARELRAALGGEERDPSKDVSMSAYDLLPQEDREAIAWVREHGGIEHVRSQWGYLRGRANHAGHVDRQLAKRQRQIDESHAALRRRNGRIAELERNLSKSVSGQLKADAALYELQRGVRDQCMAFGVDISECDTASDMLHDMNESLSKRLMPEGMVWPRIDGKPVVIGERLVGYGSGDDGYEVVGVRPTCGWVLTKSYDHITRDGGSVILEWDASKCHRPAPKVLDADGAEIRVGDTVWHVETGEQCNVVEVDSRSVSVDFLVDGDGTKHTGSVLPVNLTHRAPVLAADGKPLREGETVYHTKSWMDKEPRVIERLEPLGDEARVWFSNGNYEWSGSLTHERPDSWELITEDIASPYCADYCIKYGVDHSSMSFEYAKACDIVRRAKALAERDA